MGPPKARAPPLRVLLRGQPPSSYSEQGDHKPANMIKPSLVTEKFEFEVHEDIDVSSLQPGDKVVLYARHRPRYRHLLMARPSEDTILSMRTIPRGYRKLCWSPNGTSGKKKPVAYVAAVSTSRAPDAHEEWNAICEKSHVALSVRVRAWYNRADRKNATAHCVVE